MTITRNTALAVILCTISFSGGLKAADLDDGLVTYYPFDGDANDESGNHNNGTVYGATLAVDRNGIPNSAYYFDGIDDYIQASAELLPTGERTISLWFKADIVTNMPNLIGYGGLSCGESWLMGINHWGEPAYSLTGHCGANTLLSYYTQEPVEEWFHYAITTNELGTTIYINGSKVESNSTFVNNTVVAGTDLAIGVASSPAGYAPYVDGNVGYFMGSLDEIRIYNRALSEAEIAELYEDTETEDFLPLERGQVFRFRETDDTGTLSRFNYVALNEFVASCNGQSYRMGLVGNRRGMEEFPIRSTATQLFGFQSSNCTEQLLWQNAPVGTSWSYDEIDGSTTYVTVEATNETVVVPAGTFEGCLKFRKTAPSWGGDWVEWVQPGFFFIKMEDYSMPPYPVEELVRYRLPSQD